MCCYVSHVMIRLSSILNLMLSDYASKTAGIARIILPDIKLFCYNSCTSFSEDSGRYVWLLVKYFFPLKLWRGTRNEAQGMSFDISSCCASSVELYFRIILCLISCLVNPFVWFASLPMEFEFININEVVWPTNNNNNYPKRNTDQTDNKHWLNIHWLITTPELKRVI